MPSCFRKCYVKQSQGWEAGVCVSVGPDGKAVRSKYDPFHALLQRAQEDPSWPSEGPGFDPLASAFQVSLVLLVTRAAHS